MSDLETLKKAREYFAENGGVKRALYDVTTGKVCAVGAVNYVMTGNARGLGCQSTEDQRKQYATITLLNASARELYEGAMVSCTCGCNVDYQAYAFSVASVNDEIGFDAALHVYDHAIKTLENE